MPPCICNNNNNNNNNTNTNNAQIKMAFHIVHVRAAVLQAMHGRAQLRVLLSGVR